jgi:hypothetical protein
LLVISSVLLFAKPNADKKNKPNNKQKPEQILLTEGSDTSTIPANLKRKVDAKRPLLGHVVPQSTRSKGCKFIL